MSDTELAPWDVYREIHKAMRFALFGVTTLAGNTDPLDADAVERLLAEWHDVSFVLAGHHGHEDEFCDPLIALHAPHLRDELEAAHHESDVAIEQLQARADAIVAADVLGRQSLLQGFHLDLADFTSSYLGHLRFEEDRVMPALNEVVSDDDLEALTNQIRGSVPPPEMCVFIRYMVPSMNFGERIGMLGGMHAGAPPEIFEMFRAAAEECLEIDEYRAVAVAAGFG